MLRAIIVTCAMLAPATAVAGWETGHSRGFDYALLELPGVKVRVTCDLDVTRKGSFLGVNSPAIKAGDQLALGGVVLRAQRDGELLVELRDLNRTQLDSVRRGFAQAAKLTVVRGSTPVLEVPLGSSRPAICAKA